MTDEPSADLGPPDPRFTDLEAWLILNASILLERSYVALEEGLTEAEKLDYLATSHRLFGLIHPEAYERVMSEAKVDVAAAVLDVAGWPEGREFYEQLSAEQQAAIVARMAERASTLEQQEGTE